MLCGMIRSTSGAGTSPQDIFILAGQSNMAGRGGVDDGKWNKFVPPQCKPDPAILRLTARFKWVLAEEPLHADIDVDHVCGVGPGMAFANEVIKSRSPGTGAIGLVPCAVGGTKISRWAWGLPLYNQMVTRAWEAVKGGGTVRAVLWYQGESDTVVQSDAEAYRAHMEALINNLRADLNNPNLLIILVYCTHRHDDVPAYFVWLLDVDNCELFVLWIKVAIGSGEGKFVETVRAAQLGIRLPNVKCVDAKGLDLKNDHLHLTTTSQVKLGMMLAQAYLH